MKMTQHFPNVEVLASAPVFDVAGIMLELMAQRPPGEWVNRNTVVTAWEPGHLEAKRLTTLASTKFKRGGAG